MKLSCFILEKLYAVCMKHEDFADYHNCLKHEDAECHCLCEYCKTSEYFYYCRLARQTAAQHCHPIYNLHETLATLRGALEFYCWLKKTDFYKNICPMHRHVELAN